MVRFGALCAGWVLVVGCGGVEVSSASSASAAVVEAAGGDQGTELSATAALGGTVCSAGSGTSTLTGTVSTTGSVDSVEISAQIDGSARTGVGEIAPQDFSHDGRNKTAPYSVALPLSNGTHSVVLCFTQSGAQGREPKEVCAPPVEVTVACSSCSDQAPFGDIVGNPSLCRGNGPPHIPVHVKGDFGDAPALRITGPNGYAYRTTMAHAGDSCVYQENWDTRGNGGAGTYQFVVEGNGQTLRFSAALLCK